ncbi:hypothetical protein EE612_008777, partial [Oryza sativa]
GGDSRRRWRRRRRQWRLALLPAAPFLLHPPCLLSPLTVRHALDFWWWQEDLVCPRTRLQNAVWSWLYKWVEPVMSSWAMNKLRGELWMHSWSTSITRTRTRSTSAFALSTRL